MLDHGNGQLSAVGFYNSGLGESPVGEFFGGGVSGGKTTGPFEIEGDKVVNCILIFGRETVSCGNTQLGILGENQTPSGVIYAKVSHSSTALGLSVHHAPGGSIPENSLDASFRVLYRATGSGQNRKWADLRNQPVVVAMN